MIETCNHARSEGVYGKEHSLTPKELFRAADPVAAGRQSKGGFLSYEYFIMC